MVAYVLYGLERAPKLNRPSPGITAWRLVLEMLAVRPATATA